MKKLKARAIYLIIMIPLFSWVSISTVIQMVKCPKMTQTELFMHIPNSFVCEWKQCK